jgi:hypothetical protein
MNLKLAPSFLLQAILAVLLSILLGLSDGTAAFREQTSTAATPGLSRYRGVALADLSPQERARALVALGATEDARELSGPGLLERSLRETGRAFKNGVLETARLMVLVLSGGQLDIPRTPQLHGKEQDGSQPRSAKARRRKKAYERSGDVVLGYVADEKSGQIVAADQIQPDESLAQESILVRMNRFYVCEYPGKTPHYLFFYLAQIKPTELGQEQNATQKNEQPLRAFRADSDHAAVSGLKGTPLFTVNSVPPEGVNFYFRVDELPGGFFTRLFKRFVHFAAEFTEELLKLPAGAVPVGWHFKEASQITKDIEGWMNQRQTKPVLDTSLSFAIKGNGRLDRLRRGLYVVVQADSQDFRWDQFRYDSEHGAVKSPQSELDYNYVVVSIESIGQSTHEARTE